MLQTSRILVRAISHAAPAVIGAAALLMLAGCGQTGSLYLPAEPAAAHRATLPQSLWPAMPDKGKVGAPASPASSTAPATTTDHSPAPASQ